MDGQRNFISFCFVGIVFQTTMLTGCGVGKTVPPALVRDSIYVEKLVPVEVPPDTAIIAAYLKCTKEGRVILQNLQAEHTQNVKMKVALDSLNTLKAKVVTVRDTIYTKETIITKGETIIQEIQVEKALTRWQRWKMEVGGWAIGVLSGGIALGAVYFALKKKVGILG